MVAAWIKADTGVGPAMASGSHTCSGNCALLPIAPTNSRMPTTASRPKPNIFCDFSFSATPVSAFTIWSRSRRKFSVGPISTCGTPCPSPRAAATYAAACGSLSTYLVVSSGIFCQTPPNAQKSKNTPSTKPKSPKRLVMKAFMPAAAFCGSVYQKAMSR